MSHPPKLEKIVSQKLDLDYGILLSGDKADMLMQQLEDQVDYYDGDLTKVRVFGKWHDIPRQQVAYGDDGLEYKFSGNTIPPRSWIPPLEDLRNVLSEITGCRFNFVLVNRYRNGDDHIGEHRDNEKDLDKNAPIASVSLGQKRTFVLKLCRTKDKKDGDKLENVKLDLEHGSLLLMNPPTNEFWNHSLPVRKSAKGVRINLTFRRIVRKE